jgi:hypothetical protein
MLLAVYKEEAQIEDLISHHAPFVDEVICVHDGPCADNTMRLAGALGAYTEETAEHYGYCEPVREFARKRAILRGHTWGIVVDADERWSLNLLQSLPTILKTAERGGRNHLVINRVTHYTPEGTLGDRLEDPQTRAFKLVDGFFTNVIHTNVYVPGGEFWTLPSDLYIEHWNSLEGLKEKGVRYVRIAQELLVMYPDGSIARHLRRAIREGGTQ